jgi:hypothetical protein
MPIQDKKLRPALKHAGYSTTTILPGESAVEFEKLYRDLIAELAPKGALEDDIVATMARLLWRKQNLATFRIAALARERCNQIRSKIPQDEPDAFAMPDPIRKIDPAIREAATKVAEAQIRQELEDTYELVEMGEAATVERLREDLEVEERLDAMIDKCVKRLLMVRGLKSITSESSSAPPKRLQGPSRAA